MNVRIKRPDQPNRTVLYGGVLRIIGDDVRQDGVSPWLSLETADGYISFPVAERGGIELMLDDEPGDWW